MCFLLGDVCYCVFLTWWRVLLIMCFLFWWRVLLIMLSFTWWRMLLIMLSYLVTLVAFIDRYSRADSQHSHVILQEWIAFYSAGFLLFLFGLFVVVFNIYLNSVFTSLSDGCNWLCVSYLVSVAAVFVFTFVVNVQDTVTFTAQWDSGLKDAVSDSSASAQFNLVFRILKKEAFLETCFSHWVAEGKQLRFKMACWLLFYFLFFYFFEELKKNSAFSKCIGSRDTDLI